jgi:glycosyltransferase involved in cell wall biosynthesis
MLAQLATALQVAGSDSVAFLREGGEGWLGQELTRSGVPIVYYKLEHPLSLSCVRTLEEAFREHRIDVAHSHEFSMAVYGAWASRRTGIPHVITMHGGRYYAGRLQRRVALRTAIAFSARTIAVSDPLADDMSRDLAIRRSRVLTIPNGVQYTPPERVTLREELQLGPADRLVVAVGNLYPVKGHQHLIDALALVAGRHPTLHVAISGRGELEGALRSRARERGVESRVHLLGLRSDISAILAAADIFVLPSLSEGLPLALLEAMFAGCPIVASEVGDVGVALAHGDAGVLVRPGHAAALADALDDLLRDPKRARDLGDQAVGHARKEYGLSRMVDRYQDVYHSVLEAA